MKTGSGYEYLEYWDTSAWICEQRERLCETVLRGSRRRVDRQRAGEERFGPGGVAGLEEKRARVDVDSRIARAGSHRGFERRPRTVPLTGGCARGAEQTLR